MKHHSSAPETVFPLRDETNNFYIKGTLKMIFLSALKMLYFLIYRIHKRLRKFHLQLLIQTRIQGL